MILIGSNRIVYHFDLKWISKIQGMYWPISTCKFNFLEAAVRLPIAVPFLAFNSQFRTLGVQILELRITNTKKPLQLVKLQNFENGSKFGSTFSNCLNQGF